MGKKLLVVGLAFILATSLVACGKDTSGKTATTAQNGGTAVVSTTNEGGGKKEGGAPVKLDMWTDSGVTGIKEMIEDYTKQKGVSINLTQYQSADYMQKVRVAAASGTQPNLWQWWGGEITADFLYKGQSLDLMKYAEKYNWKKKFVPWTFEHFVRDGKLGAIPIGFTGMGMVYRKDLYEKCGVAVPKTYDEFIAGCKKLKENGIVPLTSAGKDGYMLMRIVDTFLDKFCGVKLHDEILLKKKSWDCAEVKRAYEELKMFADNGYFQEGFLSVAPADSKMFLYDGTAAGIIEGGWFGDMVIEDGQDIKNYGFYPIPTDAGTDRFGGWADSFIISPLGTVETQDASVAFVEWYTNLDTIARFQDKYFYVSATNGYEADPAKTTQVELDTIKMMKTGSCFMVTNQAFTDELANTYYEINDAVVLGKMTPAEAAAKMQREIEAKK